jgi:hypothetical protein
VIGVDQQRQVEGAVDAVGLPGEFTQRNEDQVGGVEHRQRRGRARERANFEPQILRDPRRQRVEYRGRMIAAIAFEDGPETPPPIGPVHRVPLPR